MTAIADRATIKASALWSMAFRPFFLAAAVWSATAIAIWIGLYLSGARWPSRFDPLTWHIHAMLFGFVPAAIAGFLLTAIPNWTGRRPIRGGPLVLLVLLWLTGRVAVLLSAPLPVWLAPGLDLAFPVVLCAIAAREIVAARSWRNLMMPVPVAVLAVADLLMFLENGGAPIPIGVGWRLGIVAIVALISAIGGRIVPSFTRNWLAKRSEGPLPAERGATDSLALAVLHSGMFGWALLPPSLPLAILLLLAGALNLWRLLRWRGWSTTTEPLLAALHVGYAWVVLGVVLLGASMMSAAIPLAAAVHAFTAGAMGTMILAVMTRVARGHTGRTLEADPPTSVAYGLITASAIARVAAPFATGLSTLLLNVSAALWVASFGLFLVVYGPMLVRPRVD